MAIARLNVAMAADSLLPRDACVITPHFKVTEGVVFGGAEWDSLCQDLASGIFGWVNSQNQVEVTAYDVQGPPPHFPLGHGIAGTGLAPASGIPRELAVCLSYFADNNRAGLRGRLYAPAIFLGGTPGLRPTAAIRAKVAALVPILSGLGGVNVDWCLWSRKSQAAHTVTDWWVDDEWDIVRSRGLRGTTRETGSTSG
jgi:hypothetical protein